MTCCHLCKIAFYLLLTLFLGGKTLNRAMTNHFYENQGLSVFGHRNQSDRLSCPENLVFAGYYAFIKIFSLQYVIDKLEF